MALLAREAILPVVDATAHAEAFRRSYSWHLLFALLGVIYSAVALSEPLISDVGRVGLPIHVGNLMLRLFVYQWNDQKAAHAVYANYFLVCQFVPIFTIWMQAALRVPTPALEHARRQIVRAPAHCPSAARARSSTTRRP